MSPSVTDTVHEYVVSELGVEPQRASVTFLGVEPIDVERFALDDDVVFVTVGCARHPMTDPSDIHADPLRGPRVELVVRMHTGVAMPGLHRRLATVAAAPAVEGLILAPDALVDLGEPLWDGAPFTALLTAADELGEVVLPDPMEPVRFLRAIPITANEAAWVRLKGADALREAWAEASIDIADARRSPASM
ncbi:suppressor of fused domain protein [Gordonia sp. w5E2]|uniref:suppressor of fused domain protein n=1 Tax=Gordonia TaxID=2053 RepID=UPI0009D4EB4F|nr:MULTISPECIES: suppressor of fused domain protein [Gordonia]SKZ14320.1 Suppressor of fused protein (SUFU) [Mycobacteroides abscessus subsp. abscessus]